MIDCGTVVNGYEFMNIIGSGGYATVYRVRSLRFDKIFAAKVLSISDDVGEKAWETFEAEISALMQLDHPNIIRLYDRFRIEKQFFIILEYCAQGSLWDHVNKQGPLKGQFLCHVVADLCAAVSYAWGQGIAHRDLKPQNVLIDDFGRAKLCDFGISLIQQRDSESMVQDFRCSIAYAPPEILSRLPHNPMSADVWSLGATIISLVKGKQPWDAKNHMEICQAIKTANYSLPPDTPQPIRQLIKLMVVPNQMMRMHVEEIDRNPAYLELRKKNNQKTIKQSQSGGVLPGLPLSMAGLAIGPSRMVHAQMAQYKRRGSVCKRIDTFLT